MKCGNVLCAIVCILMLVVAACSKSGTEPNKNIHLSTHKYEWQIDTLYNPEAFQVLMDGVGGADINNVWAIGHSDLHRYQFWHWNGDKWEPISLSFPGHPRSPNAIYGFSEDDIWVVGHDLGTNLDNRHSLVMRYNGTNWRLLDVNAPPCLSVWGTASDNMFVGCDSGVILHYNGNNWVEQSISGDSQIISVWGIDENTIYAIGSDTDYSQPYRYFSYSFYTSSNRGASWQKLDSTEQAIQKFGSQLWSDENGQLYSAGEEGVYKWTDNRWQSQGSFNQLLRIRGISSSNIFVAGMDGIFHHYNGESWENYPELRGLVNYISSIYMIDDAVFAVGILGNTTIALRGYPIQ